MTMHNSLQHDHALMPRSVTTARTECHGGLSEFVTVDEVDAATVLSHTQREIPADQVLVLWCRSRRRQCLRTRAERRIQVTWPACGPAAGALIICI
jgi:hypothetical protein